jgi:hypothetical protein
LLGLSVDGAWCHAAYAKDRHLHFSLLADFEPKGEVARRFDKEGVIRWSYVSPVGINPGADGILTALEALPGRAS